MEAPKEQLHIHKFPRTRHIFDAGGSGVGRDDLVMDDGEAALWYTAVVSVEEKVDGSNLGISMGDDFKLQFQNRSHYVFPDTQQQWRQLDSWVQQHPGIYQVVTPDRILFGEWLYARHSIHYTSLPDYFLAFDIYDKKLGKFVSRRTRDRLLEGTGIAAVPLLHNGVLTREGYDELLQSKSSFHDGFIEGVYVRVDEDDNEGLDMAQFQAGHRAGRGKGRQPTAKPKAKSAAAKKTKPPSTHTTTTTTHNNNNNTDDTTEHYLLDRAKIVRGDFLPLEDPDVTHWSRQKLVKNIVKYD
eukprot:TRINITY_DN5387_c2_g1_i1.p1 TRINITY_DN5387_c2_g1~~TRINITY_DN5387_c2_g1_i1.p1  ORF type:complete len:312 (+),score=91.76 TRINITY_DN5387_c2_g1_i1:44-937(+)